MKTCSVLGTPLAVTNYAGAVAQAQAWSTGTEPRLIAAANTHVVTLARHSPDYRVALAKFDLVLPDGMPLIWAMNRRLPSKLGDRVYGPTFMLRVLAADPAGPHAFLGSTLEVQAALLAKLRAQFPNLQVAVQITPPVGTWGAEENSRMVAELGAAKPRYVWVALGCPRQEEWLATHKSQLPPAVYTGVGAAFAFHAGLVRQAPAWMQRRGLEWLFRLLTEPRRLWRRYFTYNSLFIWYLWREGR